MNAKAKVQNGEKDDPSCKIKNTFLEFSVAPEKNNHKRRSCSDIPGPYQDPRLSPLVVASKSPSCSPLLQPSDEKLQAVPIDEVDFELLEESALGGPYDGTASVGAGEMVAQSIAGLGRPEPAYVVPTTPSPFLHSASPPSAMVPPFGGYGFGGMDMGLPPAFAEGDAQNGEGTTFVMQGMDGQFMQGMAFIPEMYDGAWGHEGGEFVPDGACGFGWAAWAPVQGEGAEGGFGDMAQDMSGLGVAGDGTACAGGYSAGEAQDATAATGAKAAATSAEADDGAAATQREAVEVRPAKERRDRKGKNREQREDERAERAERKGRESQAGDDSRGGGNAEASRREERRRDGGDASGNAGGEAGDIPANYTTVMLRNIPNKYTREMLIKQLSVEFHGLFDFMYLPIDFKNKCNVGYGFINFRTPDACADFVSKFHGVDVRKCLPGLNSKKIVEVTPARVQGLSENVKRLRNSPVMNQLQDHPEWMPLLFGKAGEEEPFPMPDTHLPPVKPRGRNREAKACDG